MNIFKHKKNILVLGSDGMLGQEVYKYLSEQAMFKFTDIGAVTGINRAHGYNFKRENVIFKLFDSSIHYDYCINCIAYTDTAAIEYGNEPAVSESYWLNALFPRYLAKACTKHKTKLIHISTDYVFSEYLYLNEYNSLDYLYKADIVFRPNTAEFPCNTYGAHKLLGELFIKEQFSDTKSDNYAILRTSWLYGMGKNKSFIHKFMKNIDETTKRVQDKDDIEIAVTSNEYSIPTSCNFVVKCIDNVIHDKCKTGILHAVSSENTGISRYDYANEILNAFPVDSMINGYSVNSLVNKLVKIERDSYQPKISTLGGSFNIPCYWRNELKTFIGINYKEILEPIK